MIILIDVKWKGGFGKEVLERKVLGLGFGKEVSVGASNGISR
jgi:hypothetical protein